MNRNNYCTYVPRRKASPEKEASFQRLHKELKQKFGYELGTDVFLRAGINPRYIQDNIKSLKLDSQGVPTVESLLKTKDIKRWIGDYDIIRSIEKTFNVLDDNFDNYSGQLQTAYNFNTEGIERDRFVAVVNYTEDGRLKIELLPKNQNNINKFNDQYSTDILNRRLCNMFAALGLNIDFLSSIEQQSGRVGVTDFSKAKSIANGFASIIKVANNMEGAQALPEEFSHLLVGIFYHEPLVQRALQLIVDKNLSQEILGDDYNDVATYYSDREDADSLIAEEALGHLLQKNLIKSNIQTTVHGSSLFKRLIDFIKNKFKKYSSETIEDAIVNADLAMSQLAKKILNGTKVITAEDIAQSQRNLKFNALSDRITRNIEILKAAENTELKRYRISSDSNKGKTKDLISTLRNYSQEDADTAKGILYYAQTALGELKAYNESIKDIDNMSLNGKFSYLRGLKLYVDSYGQFIGAVNEAMIDEEGEENNMFLNNIEVDGQEINIKSIIEELNNLNIELQKRFNRIASASFTEFLKPFLGQDIIVPFGKLKGQKITVEGLLKEAASDISFMDRWLDSMADSSDTLLQLFDTAVKQAKDRARLETINNIQAIQRFMKKTEEKGIKEFDWMFETDSDGNKTGNYISKVNYGQFYKDMESLEEMLDKKYGKNPSKELAKQKIQERNNWYSVHSVSTFGTPLPNPNIYRNEDYNNLTADQKEVLEEFLKFKELFDKKLPESRASNLKAIQIRKNRSQRILDSVASPTALWNNIKESFKSSLLETEDDDQIFGDSRISKGLTNFDGTEFMTLPVLYTNRLKNPNELSTDVFATLMSYAYMANNYQQMDKIINPLEIGRALVTEREVRKTRGGNDLVEKVSALGSQVTNKIFLSKSNIEDKLNDFFESQVYGRYLKDQGTFDVLGNKVNVNKLTSWILSGSSVAQLGFNWLANLANVTTGVGMQNIEAAAGEWFNAKELAKADWEYRGQIIGFTKELTSRYKTNKLALFDELFNIRQNYNKQVQGNQSKSLFKKLFGAETAFMGQEAGDHWLYNRTAIAMALREQVLLHGEPMSLWEALQPRQKYQDSDVMELNIHDIKNLDGTDFDVAKFGRKVAKINQSLFGIYNEEDANAANRVALGRLLQQYRKWMKAQYNKRFMGAQYDVTLEQQQEGYYRTFGRVMNQILRGQVQLSILKDQLTNHEKANIKRSITELIQFFAVWCLANLVEWPDDKDRPWITKLAEYATKRLNHELGGLAPTLTMPRELLKTVSNPIPSTSVLTKTINLIGSTVDPRDWVDETQSGPYKGMSTLHKNFLKAPIPGVMQYKQMDRFIEGLDTSIDFYVRNAYQ